EEHPTRALGGRLIRPDATLQDEYSIPRGHYEAKDSKDDLETEIRKKFAAGYPASNIIFEDSSTAILYQNETRVLEIPLQNDKETALTDLLTTYYHHRRPDIDGFENAMAAFQAKIPDIASTLAGKVSSALSSRRQFASVFEDFLALCRGSLNPALSPEQVQEMLVQHLLTERLIRRVFDYEEFISSNVIASEVERVITALASHDFSRKSFLRDLDPYYNTIESTASTLTEFADKQHFLDRVYEKFFQAYSPDTADTHGIVYTPPEIVHYMCASVAAALENEFQRPLGSPGTFILDPCTGTGNFIAHLIQSFIPRRNLEVMYRSQLFANEVMLMPYYIASLNIEHAYYEQMGERRPFEGLCFVDTLDSEAQQMGFRFSEDNTARIQRQKEAAIDVIIGNPPYNVGQKSENDNNKNRAYKEVDRRIRDTYSKDSSATNKNALSDAYVKFFRWATDRIGTKDNRDAVLCFVSNNSFVDQIAFDGMRKHLGQDFTLIDHIDLHGNVRKNPKISGTTHNVFGIQVGVGITLAIRKSGASRRIRYHRVPEMWTKRDKLGFLRGVEIPWQTLTPDASHNWLVPENADEFARFTSITDLFSLHTRGVQTTRDDTVYDFQIDALETRVRQFIDNYNSELDRFKRSGHSTDIDAFVNNDLLKWSESLKLNLKRGRYASFDDSGDTGTPSNRERRERVPHFASTSHERSEQALGRRSPRTARDPLVAPAAHPTSSKIRQSLYRPFTKRWLFFDSILNERTYQLPAIFPPGQPNRVIVMSDIAYRATNWTCLATDIIPDLHLCAAIDAHQCFPESHMTDSALALFRAHYQADSITRSAIFHYLYALLHHPAYRERYAEALKKELPRIPFAPDFAAFARIGERLMDLHINYESAEPYPLKWVENPDAPYSLILDDRMRLAKDRRSITYNNCLTLLGIPPEAFDYRLGHRSALEWVIDQYRVKRDDNNQITSDPNRPDDPEYILRLVAQVVTVSLETQRLVAQLPEAFT
ncbi:MAG: N-6 DNA methylase, partial [Bryobacteraceae bacterium]|nr:N-6 DNA methylase [Bryobacteraceae bacterium]